jgi:hypothetical protein
MKTQLSIMVAALAITLAPAAFAQSGDTAYCTALSHEYTKYVADPNAAKNPIQAPADVSSAQSKCASDPQSAIPVLEKALTDKKITLPGR